MQYPRRIQVKTKTRAQRLPPTEQYRWAVSSTFVALSQHGSTASMLARCLVGWLFGCLAGSLLRCLGCSRLVCVCVCVQPNQNNKRLTKQEPYMWLPLEMRRAPVPCSWKRHQRASPAKRHMSGVYRITLYLSWALTAYINMTNTYAVPA